MHYPRRHLRANRRSTRNARAAYLCNRINMAVNREDEDLCRRVRPGLKSSVYTPGPLSKLEVCVLQFRDLIRSRIPQTLLPSPPNELNW